MFEFFAGIIHFQKHKQHTSKDAEFIALHDDGSSATRFKCYKTSNDKFQQLYAVTNKLHKRWNFLLELNIFKNTNNTHQKMQNSSLYMITPLLQPDSNATIHQTTRFSNCMQTRTKLHKSLNFLLQLNIFKKHIQHTSKDAEFIALHDQGQFCNQIQMLQNIKRQDSATVCRHEQTA